MSSSILGRQLMSVWDARNHPDMPKGEDERRLWRNQFVWVSNFHADICGDYSQGRRCRATPTHLVLMSRFSHAARCDEHVGWHTKLAKIEKGRVSA